MSALMIFVACCVTGSVAFSTPRLDRARYGDRICWSPSSPCSRSRSFTRICAAAHSPPLASISWGRTLVIQLVQNGTGMFMFASVAFPAIPVAVRRFGGRGVA